MSHTSTPSSRLETVHAQMEHVASCPLRLDHIGVAVRSIASSRVFYEGLGMSASAEETVEHEQVRTLFLRLGESRLELLEPVAEASAVGRFLARRGEGLHHVAFATGNLDQIFADMQRKGIRMASEKIKTGASGQRYFFVHPASAGGVLVEFVSSVADQPAGSARR